MLGNRWLWAAICVGMGILQAWDSGVLGAPAGIQLLVVLAIAVPAATLVASSSHAKHVVSIAAAFVLLTVARVASPVPLPTLHIVAFIPAVLVFFGHVIRPRAESSST